MYGTLVRLRPAQGNEGAVRALIEQHGAGEGAAIDGFVAQYLLVPDAGNGEVFDLIVFSSEENYRKNAASLEQHARYEEVRKLLDEEPVWLDGEIVALEPSTVSL